MALEPIRPKDLAPATLVTATGTMIPGDNGAAVERVTPSQIVAAVAPVASQATAIAGVNNTQRMTPLTVKQVLDNATAPSVALAQAWAESATAPNPLDPTSKSSKTWATQSGTSATAAAGSASAAAASAGTAASDAADANASAGTAAASALTATNAAGAASTSATNAASSATAALASQNAAATSASNAAGSQAAAAASAASALSSQSLANSSAVDAASSAAAAEAAAALAAAPYTSYAAATAATVAGGVNRISVIINGVVVDYIRDATGTALTTVGSVKWSPANWEVTPYDFGANGDDATDDSAAFAAMWTWIMGTAGKWRPIFIPAGKFHIVTQFSTTVDPHNNSAEAGLFVRGAGPNTVIVNKNRDGWFKWVQASARDVRVDMRDFGIRMANGGSNGRLIDIRQVAGGLSRQSDVVIENVNIYPETATLDYAVSYARVNNVFWPKITNCNFAGPYGPGVTTETQQRGRAAIHLNGCYGADLSGTKSWGCEYGFFLRELANPGGEGGRIQGGVFDSSIGGYVYSAGSEPAFEVIDQHFNCSRTNLIIDNRKLVDVRNSLWYMEEQPVTNLLPNSTAFTLWDGVAAVASVAEDNDYTTVQTVGDVSGAANEYRRQLAVPVVSGSVYVLSVIVKQGTSAATRITSTGAALAMEARMVWGAGGVPAVTTAGAAAAASGAIDLGDGWWKVYVTGTAVASTSVNVFLYPADFVGGGTSTGNVNAVSMQLELGSEPTSHVISGATATTENPTDLKLINVDWGNVSNMKFYFSASAQRRNIVADGSCTQLIFRDNEHLAAGIGYELAAGIDDVIISNPTFGPSMNSHVVDGGVTSLRVTRDRKLYRHMTLGVAQSVPNATDTTITWDTNIGSLGFSAVVPASTITINADKGIRKVRVSLQAAWANNSTGAREIKITKNGAIVTGSGHSIKTALGLTYDRTEAEFDVVDGDVIRAVVNQTSGGALNFGTTESWIKVEEV